MNWLIVNISVSSTLNVIFEVLNSIQIVLVGMQFFISMDKNIKHSSVSIKFHMQIKLEIS